MQADNTVASAKNQYVTLVLACLVARYNFRSTTLNFLRVGHTHEDVDQFLSTLLSILLKIGHWDGAEMFVNALRPEVIRMHQKVTSWVVVEKLDGIYDFKTIIFGTKVELDGAFMNRLGRSSPHSFLFQLYADMCASNQDRAHNTFPHTHSNADVYCLIRAFMADDQFAQPPLCVLPHELCGLSLQPTHVTPPSGITTARGKDLKALINLLETQEYSMYGSAAYIRKLLDTASNDPKVWPRIPPTIPAIQQFGFLAHNVHHNVRVGSYPVEVRGSGTVWELKARYLAHRA